MVVIKKAIFWMFSPFSLCLGILLLGCLLLWFTKKEMIGKITISLGTVLLLTFGSGVFSQSVVRSLDWKYPPITDVELIEQLTLNTGKPIEWIVVLSGHSYPDSRLPLTSQLYENTLVRTVEGLRLYKEVLGTRLIFCGGYRHHTSVAGLMSRLALTLGVPHKDIVLEDKGSNTHEQARFVKLLVKDESFILVTSAIHMPRAVAIFKKQGMHPIPGPTGHWAFEKQSLNVHSFFPDNYNLRILQKAYYEYLATIYSRFRGQL